MASAGFAQEEEPAPLSFPRTHTADSGSVVVHLPQVDAWDEFETLEARAAIEVTPAGEDEPVFGVVEFIADTDPNLELRVVAIENLAITATNFPEADEARRELLDSMVHEIVQPRDQFVPLDAMLTYVADDIEVEPEPGLSYEPPPIFYSSVPAILVNLDGEPILE